MLVAKAFSVAQGTAIHIMLYFSFSGLLFINMNHNGQHMSLKRVLISLPMLKINNIHSLNLNYLTVQQALLKKPAKRHRRMIGGCICCVSILFLV